MGELALSAVLFHSLSAVLIVLGAAVLACRPQRLRVRSWVFNDVAPVARAPIEAVELPHAA